jgi:DNA-binding CsgD family transcriptional regulator
METQFLTARQLEIMKWVRQGKTNYEIGVIMDISPFTVKNHLQKIYQRLKVSNRMQAVALY